MKMITSTSDDVCRFSGLAFGPGIHEDLLAFHQSSLVMDCNASTDLNTHIWQCKPNVLLAYDDALLLMSNQLLSY